MRLLSRVLALLIVALVFCAPLFRGLQSVDQENDEAIYSYAAESIVETGDWMNPRSSPSSNTVFLEKPPLKFWIVALPIRLGLLPDNDFGLRFWDPVLGGLAFLYVFAFGRRLAGWSCGAAALVILYTFNDLIFTHGLRGNNMEAALVLAYAGGIYHYLRWTETERRGTARAHAAAVGFYFFLAFMTKFVAAAFMPAVMLAASAEVATVRAKVLREWRTWLGVCAGVVLLAAPWFVYQSLQPGHAIWSIMFGEHVVRRFHAWLDPAHLHPWYCYFQYLSGGLLENGTIWAVVAGAALIHVRVVRERWLAGTLVLYWFWLPFVVMSFGSSKLWHYAYPFLAPVALAAGYAVGATADAVARGIAKLEPAGGSRATFADRRRAGEAWLRLALAQASADCRRRGAADRRGRRAALPEPARGPRRDGRHAAAAPERVGGPPARNPGGQGTPVRAAGRSADAAGVHAGPRPTRRWSAELPMNGIRCVRRASARSRCGARSGRPAARPRTCGCSCRTTPSDTRCSSTIGSSAGTSAPNSVTPT